MSALWRTMLVHSRNVFLKYFGWQCINMRLINKTIILAVLFTVLVGCRSVESPEFTLEKRSASQRETCYYNLRTIYSAIEGVAMRDELSNGTVIPLDEVTKLMLHSRLPDCPCGGTYTVPPVGGYPSCSFHGAVTTAVGNTRLEWVKQKDSKD